jgi:hypothetical protein
MAIFQSRAGIALFAGLAGVSLAILGMDTVEHIDEAVQLATNYSPRVLKKKITGR